VVEYLDQILPGMDGDIRKDANRMFKKQGFDIKTGTKVTGCSVRAKKATLTMEPAKGGDSETLEADVVLVAIGRRPNIDGLDLDKSGVETNDRGQIEVGHD
jgi:dihydrolipoamide dehydrogenase